MFNQTFLGFSVSGIHLGITEIPETSFAVFCQDFFKQMIATFSKKKNGFQIKTAVPTKHCYLCLLVSLIPGLWSEILKCIG